MRHLIKPFASKAMIATAAFAIAGGSLCTYFVRADDMTKMAESKMDGMKPSDSKTAVSADDSKMMVDRIDKMKENAADPAKAEMMEKDMAKMMVMDHLAKALSDDATVKSAMMEAMADPNVKKVHEEAMKMAKDPEMMKKMEDEITADPEAMKHVDHSAMMMAMHGDTKMGKMSKQTNDAMK